MKPQQKRQVECTIPVLTVRDLARSIRFYTETLGFELDWGGEPGGGLCSVSRDGCSIMLRESEAGAASGAVWVWIGVEDDTLFDGFRAKGATVLQEPRNCSWAYEMMFVDLDGNVLWLGTETKRDLPLEDDKND